MDENQISYFLNQEIELDKITEQMQRYAEQHGKGEYDNLTLLNIKIIQAKKNIEYWTKTRLITN